MMERPAPYYAIPKANPGYQMLKKLGWSEEKGLGVNEQGNKGPLKTVLKNDRLGLGRDQKKPRVTHFNPLHEHSEKEIREILAQSSEKQSKRSTKFHRRQMKNLIRIRDDQLRQYLKS
jgi:hypothetical protein